MSFQYEPIYGRKWKHSLLMKSDFTPHESNILIESLVERIKRYEQTRGIETRYERIMTPHGERVTSVQVRTNDGVVQGTIQYMPPCVDPSDGSNARIAADFQFNSQSESDKEEYLGLWEIIKKF